MSEIACEHDPSPLKAVAAHLFKELSEEWDTDGEVSDGLLRDLLTLFPNTLLSAFDLVDREAVSKLTSPSGRCIYQVMGISEESYSCLLEANYCPCTSFMYSVITKGEAIMCKHLLSVHLSISLGKVSHTDLSNHLLTTSLANLL